jgi:hypothetical protein
LKKLGIAAVAALTFGGAVAAASTEALAFKGGFGGGGFGGHGFGGGGFAARGFGGGGFAARGFGGAGPMFAGRSVAVNPGFATRGFAGVRPGFAGRNFVFHRGFRHNRFGFGLGAGLAAATLVGAAAYPYYYGCDPYWDGYDYPYACGYPSYPYYW